MTSKVDNEGGTYPKDYSFGIELELLMFPKDPRFHKCSLEDVQKHFADLWEKDMDTSVYRGLSVEKELVENFVAWKLRLDGSIGTNPVVIDGRWYRKSAQKPQRKITSK